MDDSRLTLRAALAADRCAPNSPNRSALWRSGDQLKEKLKWEVR